MALVAYSIKFSFVAGLKAGRGQRPSQGLCRKPDRGYAGQAGRQAGRQTDRILSR